MSFKFNLLKTRLNWFELKVQDMVELAELQTWLNWFGLQVQDMVELVDQFELQDMVELFDNQQTSGACLLIKMLSVVAVPAISVLVFSSLML